MSHVHNVAGQSNAAAEYQAYLEALKAARQARENNRAQGDGAVRTFDSEIDPDQDGAEEERQDETGGSASDEVTADEPSAEATEPDAGGPPSGLGKHYA